MFLQRMQAALARRAANGTLRTTKTSTADTIAQQSARNPQCTPCQKDLRASTSPVAISAISLPPMLFGSVIFV